MLLECQNLIHKAQKFYVCAPTVAKDTELRYLEMADQPDYHFC